MLSSTCLEASSKSDMSKAASSNSLRDRFRAGSLIMGFSLETKNEGIFCERACSKAAVAGELGIFRGILVCRFCVLLNRNNE